MFSSPPYPYLTRPTKNVSVFSPFLRHLTTGLLALAMFVALALLSTTRRKESESRRSAPTKATKSEVIIDDLSFSPDTLRSPEVLKVTSIAGPTVTQAKEKGPLSPGPVRPGLNHGTELPQGYLMVYSATDAFDDGGLSYYAHSSYSIYTSDGKFFKNVENHISPSDEIPALVMLPAGSYTIEARSESRGYVRLPIVITPRRRTILDLDTEQTDGQKLSTRTKHSRRLVDQPSHQDFKHRVNFSISRKLT